MYVHVNAAMSADGKLSSRRREQIAISGPSDFDRVDRIRADSDAVMVGIGTVLADDPRLGLESASRVEERRAAGMAGHPARVVADSEARTPPDAAILDDTAATYILVSELAPAERRQALREAGAELLVTGDERVALPEALAGLETEGMDRLMVEGGGELLFSLFDAGLVDHLTVYVGSMLLGGREAPTLIDGEGWTADFPQLSLEAVDRLDDGVVLTYDPA
ncbi:MAG: 2,5-diamino-6-(ribosylamino)-4(3H)-pyrimidinone 5'-phosphate reductase [Halobacteriaceae archaeon]